jgi:putative ABC transport system permease protein
MLNFDIYNYRVDLWAYGLIVVMGLLIPLLASAYPIYRGSQKTVLEALTDYGVRQGQVGRGRIDVWLSKVTGIARPLLLSLRNAFRRRNRLILTLVTLTVGGANFATAINVASSLDATVDSKFDAIPYNIEIVFSQSYPQNQIEQAVSRVDGVERVETWGGALSNLVLPDGMLGEELRLIAPPANSQLMPNITIQEGRWLRPDDQHAIVINATLLKKLKLEAEVGDEIALDINGITTTWQLVGISQEYLSSTAYVPFDVLAQTLGQQGQAATIVVQTTESAATDKVAQNLEIQLSNAGFDVYTLWKTEDTRLVFKMHMLMITVILLVMAALFVLVGGLGLASAIGLNVLERTRELGILRAIGASTQRVLQIITLEGVFVGLLSWIFAILLSLPLTWGMTQIFDKAFDMPVKLTISSGGGGLWLLAVVIISLLASIVPAWNAAQRPVDEVLAYE